MKKLFAAAALSLSALLLFTGCSAQITTDISSGWLTNPATNFDSSFYESLDYKSGFAMSETAENLTIEIDAENSAYNITTKALSSYTLPDGSATYTNVYHLTITQTVSATYSYKRDNGEVLKFSFGGASDTDPDNTDFAPEDADQVLSEVWFTSPSSTVSGAETEPPVFSPIRSVQTTRSHGAAINNLADDSKMFVSMYDYSFETVYDVSCQNATFKYSDNFADLTDEERAPNEYVRKNATSFPKTRTVGNLQKYYTCIDNAQLFFIARGLEMNTESSNTLTVVSGVGSNYPDALSISCSELVNSRFSFTMVNEDGSETVYDNQEIAVARMTFALASSGSNKGENTEVTYAQRPAEGTNTNRCLPVRISVPFGWNVGTYTYSLVKASYVAPAGAQD